MRPTTVEVAGIELAYEDLGEGPNVVLVHGTASMGSIWDEVLAALGTGYRTIRYDRRGYGYSGEPEGYTRTSVEEHGADLSALLRARDAAPALLCGHSFGAMACLDVILREPEMVTAAVIAEPPMLWLTPEGNAAVSELYAAVDEGAAAHGPAGAIASFTQMVCGPDSAAVVGRRRALAAMQFPRAFAADIEAVGKSSVPPRELRAIDTPIVCLVGSRTPPQWRRPCEELARIIPSAELRECNSGHLMPNEAPEIMADVIRGLIQP